MVQSKELARLEKECGVTRISIRNAAKLRQERGVPDEIRLFEDMREDYVVQAIWYQQENGLFDSDHTFTGFSWGYAGEGPRGLRDFFEMCGVPVGQDEIYGWSRSIDIRFKRGDICWEEDVA